jgi:predicted neuraminidase
MNQGYRPSVGLVVTALLGVAVCAAAAGALQARRATDVEPVPGGVTGAFVFEQAPFESCHASTIVETTDGQLLCAFFAGKDEGDPSVGIWLSRHDGAKWSAPVEVADGVVAGGTRHPCWNPVLFQPASPAGAPLMLFYKVGPSPSTWWGMLMTSADAGATWSNPARLPDGILGPVKNKPIELPDGTLLCGSSTEHDGWRVHFERTPDLGKTWTKTGALNDRDVSLIQPTILRVGEAGLVALCRSRQGKVYAFRSPDLGGTWGAPAPTELPNSSTGVDGVTLADGPHVLVYNHTPKGRTPLNVGVSTDAERWRAGPVLESAPGEYSYPAVIQARDGRIHATYTWNRKRIKHVVIDPASLPMP